MSKAFIFFQWAVGLEKKYQELEDEKEKIKVQQELESGGATVTELPAPSIEGTIREKSIQLYQIQKQREAAQAGEPINIENTKTVDLSRMVRMRVT